MNDETPAPPVDPDEWLDRVLRDVAVDGSSGVIDLDPSALPTLIVALAIDRAGRRIAEAITRVHGGEPASEIAKGEDDDDEILR